jgi:hypothetical protein
MSAEGTRRIARTVRSIAPWMPLAAYAASRVFYAELGLALDDSSIPYFWQYLDPEQLRTNLWESVYYQHTQPPLYNLFLGAMLKTERPEFFLRLAGLVFGVALHFGLYALMARLGVRAWLAALLASLFAFNPASILMELWVFYSYPTTAMLVVAVWLFHRGIARDRAWSLFGAFALLAAVVCTRSVFHLAWMGVAVAIGVWASRRRLRTCGIALVPLALASSVYVKNYVEFGTFTSSTWLGFSLSRLTTTQLDRASARELMERGELSELGVTLPWLPLRQYPADVRDVPAGTADTAVLIESTKSTGNPNFNHAAYIAISSTFLRDARTVLRVRPDVWWRSTKRAWLIYFLPIHDYSFFHAQRQRARAPWRTIERGYEWAFGSYAFAAWDGVGPPPPFEERQAWGWAIAMGISIAIAIAIAVRRGRTATSATLALAVFSILFVAVVGNSVELGENHRFRFLTEPFAWALVALALELSIATVGRTWRRARRSLAHFREGTSFAHESSTR